MNKTETFRVTWQTGYINVYVSKFFGKAKPREVNNLFKLSRIYCSDEQRIALLKKLEKAEQEQIMAAPRKRIEQCIKKIKTQKWGAENASERARR